MAGSWRRQWNCRSCAPHSLLSCQGFGKGSMSLAHVRGAGNESPLLVKALQCEFGCGGRGDGQCLSSVPQSAVSLWGVMCSLGNGCRADSWLLAVFLHGGTSRGWLGCSTKSFYKHWKCLDSAADKSALPWVLCVRLCWSFSVLWGAGKLRNLGFKMELQLQWRLC